MALSLTVIGAGPGGYVAAVRAAQLGARVTVIEQDNVGGTCLNRGCIPSKVMQSTAEMLERLKTAPAMGIALSGTFHPDMERLMERKQKIVQDQVEGILRLFRHHRITLHRGTAFVKAPGHVEIKTQEGEVSEVSSDRLILAMGSRPLETACRAFDGETILSSDHALMLRKVPESILIIGGGVIGCEFGFIFSCLGSKVTIVEALDRILPLPSVDEACSRVIQREMKKRRMDLFLGKVVEEIELKAGRCSAKIGPSRTRPGAPGNHGQPTTVEAEKILVCIGRRPNTDGVGLENLGVKLDDRGWVLADERMRTHDPKVYAIGDLLGPSRIMLAHVATREGLIAAENIMGGENSMDYGAVPGAIFTLPEVAVVGLTERQARERGYEFRSDTVLFRNLGKSQVIGEIAGEAKIVSDEKDGRVLGVHMVGPHVTDLIAEGTLAINTDCTVEDLARTIHAHPTLSEIMLEGALKAAGRPLHG